MSNSSSIKYPRLRVRAGKKNIYDIYNIYTFAGKTGLLSICQILLAVPLPVTLSFAVEALSIFVRDSSRGFLGLGTRLAGALALGLALLLETSGLADCQHIVRVSLHGR